jgi:cell division transport system permease protein
MGLIIINAHNLSKHVKENIGFTVALKDNIKEADIIWLQKTLDASGYARSTRFITKEEAAEELIQELGEDFVGFLGYNPLPSSIDVHLHAQYANPDSINMIKHEFLDFPQVKEVFYQESLVHLVNKNIKMISAVILLFSAFLLIIAIALINNTIRLSVYSKRFTIRTMQLVGATESFIRKPFIISSIMQALLASLISLTLFFATIYILQQEFEEFFYIEGMGILTFLVVLCSITITSVSTWFSVNRYLRLKTDELYY